MPTSSDTAKHSPSKQTHWLWVALAWIAGLSAAAILSVLTLVALALALAYPNLPDISDIADYRPKLPLRVFSADGDLIGEFG